MATGSVNKVVVTTVALNLSREEAAYLKGVLQNPMCAVYHEEPEQDTKCRTAIWNALPNEDQLMAMMA